MKNKNPLPCPFCGETEIEVVRPGTNRASRQVRCTNCGCDLETNEIDSWDEWNSRDYKVKMEKKLNEQDFYDMMQQYRHSPMGEQDKVVENFENVKQWIIDNL